MRAVDRSEVRHVAASPGVAHEIIADLNARWENRGWQVALYGSLATGAPLGGDVDVIAFAIKAEPDDQHDLLTELMREWELLDSWYSLMSDSYTLRRNDYLLDLSFRFPGIRP